MLATAANQISLGNVLVVTVGVVLSVPSSILAWHSLSDRSERREERRLNELIARRLVGDHIISNPEQAEKVIREKPSLAQQLEAINHQVTPSNGKTVATTIEEVRRDMMTLAIQVGEHMSDGHGGQVWPGVPSRSDR